jgi:CHAD domain-containing protein
MSISSERCEFVFQKTARDLRRLASEQQPEAVHSFRTSTRRLQILLKELIPERDRKQKKLLKTLDRIRKRAGKVRDLDMQLGALRSLKVPQEPRRKTHLMHRLIELRAKHEKKLRNQLDKQTIRELRKQIKRAGKDLQLEKGRDPVGVARQELAKIARPAGPLSVELLHQYRVAVKRARYAAEFAAKSPESAELIEQLKRVQDSIGHWHDWLILTNTASERLGDVGRSSLVAALHNITGGKFRHAVAALTASPALLGPKPMTAMSEAPRKAGTKSGLSAQAESAA